MLDHAELSRHHTQAAAAADVYCIGDGVARVTCSVRLSDLVARGRPRARETWGRTHGDDDHDAGAVRQEALYQSWSSPHRRRSLLHHPSRMCRHWPAGLQPRLCGGFSYPHTVTTFYTLLGFCPPPRVIYSLIRRHKSYICYSKFVKSWIS